MIAFFNYFVKITGFIPYILCFRTKVHFESPAASRRIKGRAVVISNHTSVWDYAVMLFVFFSRTVRVQMAEVLFKKPFLGVFLRMLGGIYVDRDARNFSFVHKSEQILLGGGVVGIFPESRLPLKGESRPLDFKPSAAFIALSSSAPIIPIYTNGVYFNPKMRCEVMVGEPIDPRAFSSPDKDEKEILDALNTALREKIIDLEKQLYEKT